MIAWRCLTIGRIFDLANLTGRGKRGLEANVGDAGSDVADAKTISHGSAPFFTASIERL
jgi:hypothetical protein